MSKKKEEGARRYYVKAAFEKMKKIISPRQACPASRSQLSDPGSLTERGLRTALPPLLPGSVLRVLRTDVCAPISALRVLRRFLTKNDS